MTRRFARTTMVAVLWAAFGMAAYAQPRRPRATLPTAPPAQRGDPGRPELGFYPEAIDGGVRGNLPFNNQIRKFSDPLNANGGR